MAKPDSIVFALDENGRELQELAKASPARFRSAMSPRTGAGVRPGTALARELAPIAHLAGGERKRADAGGTGQRLRGMAGAASSSCRRAKRRAEETCSPIPEASAERLVRAPPGSARDSLACRPRDDTRGGAAAPLAQERWPAHRFAFVKNTRVGPRRPARPARQKAGYVARGAGAGPRPVQRARRGDRHFLLGRAPAAAHGMGGRRTRFPSANLTSMRNAPCRRCNESRDHAGRSRLDRGRQTRQLRDYLPRGFVEVNLGTQEQDDGNEPQFRATSLSFFAHDFLHAPRGDFILQENRRDLFLDHVRDWLTEKWEVAIFCNNEGEQKRLEELLREAQVCRSRRNHVPAATAPARFRLAGRHGSSCSATRKSSAATRRCARLRRQERLVNLRSQTQALDFTEIADGDYVVHLHHGIALYKGVTSLPGATEDASAGGGAGARVRRAEQALRPGRAVVPRLEIRRRRQAPSAARRRSAARAGNAPRSPRKRR